MCSLITERHTIEKERIGHSQLQREYELYSSHDKGETWTAVNEFFQVFDVAEFKGTLFALAVDEEGEKPYLSGPLGLFRSTNGRDWETIWKFQAPAYSIKYAQLMVLGIEQFMDQGSIGEFPGDKKLFVQFKDGRFELSVSSSDGNTWFNNGSSRLGGSLGGPWNPLDLPDSDFIVPQPDWENLQQASGIYRISEHEVEVLYNQQWIGGTSSFEETAIPFDTVALWDNLSFAYGLSNIVSVTDKEIISYPAPDFADGILSFDQLIAVGGIYYAVVRTDHFPFYRFGWTTDLENWHRPSPPDESNSFRLFSKGSTVAAFYSPFFATMDYPIKAISIWDGLWVNPLFPAGSTKDVTFVPATDQFYYLTTSYEYLDRVDPKYKNVKVWKLAKNGQYSQLTRFVPEVWNGYYNQITCPDGENIVVYGDSAEVAFIQTDGTVRISHPWQFFSLSEYRIDSVKFVNGWYYLLGKVAIRTKDFIDYELVPLPLDQPLTDVVGFGDHLYGFVSGAVYRQPMEKGYLDSIIQDQGWRQSDWLGWFQIIDEEKGDIDHLLLDKCWVKQVSDQEYWLRTSTLGWIYIYKDWSPWFWRMDDGHWYWLDQDGWPPRAWDYDEGQWVQLGE